MVGEIVIGHAAINELVKGAVNSRAHDQNNLQVKETQRTQIFELPMMRQPGFTANDQAVKTGTIGAVVQVTIPQSKDGTVGKNFQISA